jgi:hypothetical protein
MDEVRFIKEGVEMTLWDDKNRSDSIHPQIGEESMDCYV